MIDYSDLYRFFAHTPALRPWLAHLPAQVAEGFSPDRWGDLPAWESTLAALPRLQATEVELKDAVRCAGNLSEEQNRRLETVLRELHPWRKGPWQIFDVFIDTEWRSDWKWDRVLPHLDPLDDRLVLDVGCGNGYHCWRTFGAGARQVIGIDPSPKFVAQFYALKRYLGAHAPVDLLPLGIEDVTPELRAFDTTFSMGVLYHRRSPMDHLRELRGTLRRGGQLVLETLVIEGDLGECLIPEGRYAQMRNVWALPSCATLESWLRKCGFSNTRTVDLCKTTTSEQRRTDWMTFDSLQEFLSKDDPDLTLEGHPAPLRAVITAYAD